MGSAGGAAGASSSAATASSPLLLPRAPLRPAAGAEVWRQVGLAAPLVTCSLLQYSLQVVSVMFAGHLGELSLSGASVAASFANVTGFSVLLGMGSALDTFCGQSYGARQFDMLGTHTQWAIVVLMLTGVPLTFVLAFTGQILIALGQNPEISSEAGLYAQWLIPGLFSYGLLQCLTRFLQTQNSPNIGSLLWTYFATSHYAMLAPGSNFWPRPQRCSFGDLNILLVLCGIASNIKSLKLVEGVGMDGLGRH